MAIAEIPKKQVKQDSPAEQIRKSKQRKAEFLERKRRVMRLEIDNTNKVIFFRQNNDYWHLGGVSALLYTYVVAKRYKRNARIIEDDTKDCKFPDGIVAVKTRTMLQMITMMVKDGDFAQLKEDVKLIEEFASGMGLTLHPKKRYIQKVDKGVSFLGARIYPGRILVGKRVKGNFYKKYFMDDSSAEEITSYLSLMQNFRSWNLIWKNILKISLQNKKMED